MEKKFSFKKYDHSKMVYDGNDIMTFLRSVDDFTINAILSSNIEVKGKKVCDLSESELEEYFSISKGDYIFENTNNKFPYKEIRSSLTVDEYLSDILSNSDFTDLDIINRLKSHFYLKDIYFHLSESCEYRTWTVYPYTLIDIIKNSPDRFLIILTKTCGTLKETLSSNELVGVFLDKDVISRKVNLSTLFIKVFKDDGEYGYGEKLGNLDDFIKVCNTNLKIRNSFDDRSPFSVIFSDYLTAMKVSYKGKETSWLHNNYCFDVFKVNNKSYLLINDVDKGVTYLLDEHLNNVFGYCSDIIHVNNYVVLISDTVKKHAKVIDLRNNDLVFECDDIIINGKSNFYKYVLNGNIGYLDKKFRNIIPNIYEGKDDFGCVVNNLIICKLHNKYGVINDKNSVIIPFKYDILYPLCDNFFICKNYNLEFHILIDSNGNEIINENDEFKNCSFYKKLNESDNQFFVDNVNKLLIKHFSNNQYEVINLKNSKSFRLDNLKIVNIEYFENNLIPVIDCTTSLYGAIDFNGNLVFPCLSEKSIKFI